MSHPAPSVDTSTTLDLENGQPSCNVGVRYDEGIVAACYRRNGNAEFLRAVSMDPAPTALADWVSTRQLRGADAAISVPRRWFTVRYVDLPSQVADELEALVQHRAGELLADAPDDYDISWSSIDTLASGWSRVAMMACPREKLRGAITTIEDSGLRVASVTLDSAALVAGFESMRDSNGDRSAGRPEGLLLVEEEKVTLAVARRRKLLFSRQVRWREKRDEEGNATSTEQRVAGNEIERFIRETMQSFRARCPDIEIDGTCILSTRAIAPLLPADLGAADLSMALPAPERGGSPSMATADAPIDTGDLVPLGLTHGPAPSITPEWLLRRARAHAVRSAAGRAALAIVILGAVWLARTWSNIAATESRVASVAAEIAVLEAPARRLLAMQTHAAPARPAQHRCLVALRAIESALPRQAQLRSFDFTAPGDVVVVGTTADVGNVVDVVRAMEEHPAVARVELTETRRARAEDRAPSTFVVRMTLRTPTERPATPAPVQTQDGAP